MNAWHEKPALDGLGGGGGESEDIQAIYSFHLY